MTKQFHPIRALTIMFILLLLIALPPLFRIFFPNTEETKSKNNDRITLLTCTRDYAEEQTTVTIESRYVNSKIKQTKIVYSTMLEAKYIAGNNTSADYLPSMELSYFQNLEGITIEQIEGQTTVIINQNTIDKNQNDSDLKNNYFNDKLINQKIYLANRYFECDETTV